MYIIHMMQAMVRQQI